MNKIEELKIEQKRQHYSKMLSLGMVRKDYVCDLSSFVRIDGTSLEGYDRYFGKALDKDGTLVYIASLDSQDKIQADHLSKGNKFVVTVPLDLTEEEEKLLDNQETKKAANRLDFPIFFTALVAIVSLVFSILVMFSVFWQGLIGLLTVILFYGLSSGLRALRSILLTSIEK